MAGSWIEIDRKRLLANVDVFKKRLGDGCQLMAVVKANAYGHGAVNVAHELANVVDWLGVDSVVEAHEIAVIRLDKPLLILGHVDRDEIRYVVEQGFRVAVFRRDTAVAMAEAARELGVPARAHVKIETGLYRLGVPMDALSAFARFLGALDGVVVEGVYTHLADVEDPESTFCREQLDRLTEAVDVLHDEGIQVQYVHASPSAGALLHNQATMTITRVGIGLYGVWPSSATRAASPGIELEPVLSWKCRIAQIKTVAAGESVGYDRTYRASSERRIAVIPVGYYDGLDRKLSGKGAVLVRGERAPVVGRVAMNMTMIDVTETGAEDDDEVVLIGEQGSESITADDVAAWSDTIAYEVLARLNREIPRSVR